MAVGGFLVFGCNDFGESDKPKYGGIFSAVASYGGNFLAVGSFSFFGGNDFGGSGKPNCDGIFSAVMQYGGNVLAMSGFLFFGGNVNVNSKLGGNCGA